MRSEAENIFLAEPITIIDIEGIEVCKIKRYLPAKKEIPIINLLLSVFEEGGLNDLIKESQSLAQKPLNLNLSKKDKEIAMISSADQEWLGLLIEYLPKILRVFPGHLVKGFSILVDLNEEQVTERFSLLYMMEVLIPFLSDVFKNWAIQFQKHPMVLSMLKTP